ncbi:glutathione peroxidase [Candidatus Cyanaurora vandensis]|uniref:glutathione peroxidase n=1 Tax=Candidatus Cyanaurora vandensis TaxID=2714958 RepID=UPI00257AE834|nr:glutathione peroxidase [Candidatus Cyanaurora vandensis]
MSTFYSFTVKGLAGEPVALSQYVGQVALVVNVASYCGYTNHYRGLQQLYNEYKDLGFVVLGFPCNDFGGQEPGTEAEIQTFCATRYQVDFPLFGKVQIKGQPTDIYRFLGADQVQWNFHKFLLNKQGEVLRSYGSAIPPETPQLRQAIESLLAQ